MLNRLELLCCRIIGDGNKNLQHIVQVFVKVLSHGNELAEPETADHMVRLLSQMQGSLPPQVRRISSSSHMSPSSSVHQGAALIAGAHLQWLFVCPEYASIADVHVAMFYVFCTTYTLELDVPADCCRF